MDNRFLDLIERSMKEHWDLPAFSDYNGHTFHFTSYWNMPVSRKATKWPSSDATPPTGQSAFSEYWLTGLLPCRSCMSSNPTISITSSTIREQKPYWQAPATGRT